MDHNNCKQMSQSASSGLYTVFYIDVIFKGNLQENSTCGSFLIKGWTREGHRHLHDNQTELSICFTSLFSLTSRSCWLFPVWGGGIYCSQSAFSVDTSWAANNCHVYKKYLLSVKSQSIHTYLCFSVGLLQYPLFPNNEYQQEVISFCFV